ncbi:ribosome-inactivating family protein [Streptomyces sp. NPDC001351]|uniref:ribosome-inactivating family protein n=1 Tax=unclassified Streptomyces TaxID=2593676 RepID=UPI00368376E8
MTKNDNDYFPLTLRLGQTAITLIFNGRNGYVTGWFNEQTRQYVRLDTGPVAYEGQAGQNRNWFNYNDMERAAGVDRGTVGITMGAIQGSISDLARGNSQDQARALLVLVQAFSEGARFDFISYRISQAMRYHSTFYAGSPSVINGAVGLSLEGSPVGQLADQAMSRG